ncbi:uncharacterized protein C713.09-like [Nicotiana sylvestris]|uniref:uncharacterized protein C713.09-like n=1 Tax=Nicotiana sylvestris TaxID=4096 RepID=UPI00388C787C
MTVDRLSDLLSLLPEISYPPELYLSPNPGIVHLLDGASSRSPRLENKQPKRQHSSSTGGKNKKVKKFTTELATTNIVFNDDGEASDEEASLQRRHKSLPAQQNAQSRELRTPIKGDAALNSKVKEATVAEEKRAQIESMYRNIIDQNKVCITTIRDLDLSLRAMRSERDGLLTEVDRLKAKLQHQGDSLIIENTYSMYHMRRNTLEEAKAGVIDINDEIAKALTLELTTLERLPAQPDANNSTSTSFEFSGTEEELEENHDEGQDPVPSSDPPTSLGGIDASLPPSSRGNEV